MDSCVCTCTFSQFALCHLFFTTACPVVVYTSILLIVVFWPCSCSLVHALAPWQIRLFYIVMRLIREYYEVESVSFGFRSQTVQHFWNILIIPIRLARWQSGYVHQWNKSSSILRFAVIRTFVQLASASVTLSRQRQLLISRQAKRCFCVLGKMRHPLFL